MISMSRPRFLKAAACGAAGAGVFGAMTSGIDGNVDLDACALSKTALNNLRLP